MHSSFFFCIDNCDKQKNNETIFVLGTTTRVTGRQVVKQLLDKERHFIAFIVHSKRYYGMPLVCGRLVVCHAETQIAKKVVEWLQCLHPCVLCFYRNDNYHVTEQ
jgi:hypothetical protein